MALVAYPFWFALCLGLIPAAIAANRGSRAFFGWWAFGTLLFIVALPLALMRRDETKEDLKAFLAGQRQSADDEEDPFDSTPPLDVEADSGRLPSWVAGLRNRPPTVLLAVAGARRGDQLMMKRDPFNVVDPRAVELHWQGHMIGYVPLRHAPVVADRIDKGRPVAVSIARVACAGSIAEAISTEISFG